MNKSEFLLLILFGVFLISGCTQLSSVLNDSPKEAFSSTSLKDLSQNPSDYLNKTITITGKLNNRLGGHSLEDNDGYWVWIDDNCVESQREYEYNSKLYSSKGIWVPPEPSIGGVVWGVIHNYRLSCTFPLS